MYCLELVKADGRSLYLYGIEPVVCDEDAPSPQAGKLLTTKAQLRWHPLRGEWVAYAPHRQSRTFLPPPNYNPLRPTTDPSAPTELPRGRYDVAVFDNLFPTLSLTAADAPASLVPTLEATGHCEVVVYAQDPTASLCALPLAHIELLLEVWARHTELNAAHESIKYVLPFENRGVEVGGAR